MPGICKLVILSAALMFGSPALAIAQTWPPGSAMATGQLALEAKTKAVEALERANGDLVAALRDPAFQDRRSLDAVRSLQAMWLNYVTSECDLVGAATLAASPWQSTYAVQCQVKLIEWRAKQIAEAAECVTASKSATGVACLRSLALLATQAGVR